MSQLQTNDEPYVGGHYDALAPLGISYLGADGSLCLSNESSERNKSARRHLQQVFGAIVQDYYEPWAVLGCEPSVPEGRLPELVGGLIAIWRNADDMHFNPKIGEFGEADTMLVDSSILEGFQESEIPGKEAVALLIGSVFPVCLAITWVAGIIVVELPRTDPAVFLKTLEEMPIWIQGAPFILQYHNGPLANVDRRRRAKTPKPKLAEKDCNEDDTDYVAEDGQFYPGAMLSSMNEKGNIDSSVSASILVQKEDQQRLIVPWHNWGNLEKHHPGLLLEVSKEADKVFRVIQGQPGTEVGRVVHRMGETDIALARLHPGMKFVNRFMEIDASAKTLVPSDKVKIGDQFFIDNFTTGKQRLVSLGRRYLPEFSESRPRDCLVQKRFDSEGNEIDVVMIRAGVAYIALEQGVSGTSDNFQSKKPYIRGSACGSVLIRCLSRGKKHLDQKNILTLGEVCGMFHFADPESVYADSAGKYLAFSDAMDPLIEDGWKIAPASEQSVRTETKVAPDTEGAPDRGGNRNRGTKSWA